MSRRSSILGARPRSWALWKESKRKTVEISNRFLPHRIWLGPEFLFRKRIAAFVVAGVAVVACARLLIVLIPSWRFVRHGGGVGMRLWHGPPPLAGQVHRRVGSHWAL